MFINFEVILFLSYHYIHLEGSLICSAKYVIHLPVFLGRTHNDRPNSVSDTGPLTVKILIEIETIAIAPP